MPRLKVTDDDYDMLTEEERIGLKEHQAELEAEAAAEDAAITAAAAAEPEDEPATKPKPKKAKPEPADEPAEEAPSDDDEAEADDEPEGEDEDDPPDEGESEEGEEGEEGEEEEDDEDESPPLAAAPTVPPTPKLTEAEEKRLIAIKGELKDIAKQFDDGDLTAQEMRDQQEVLLDERDALKEKRTLAAMSVQTAVNTWYYTTIPIFMAKHPEYKDGSLRHKLLDTIVREMQAGSETPTDPKILVEAHAKVVAEFGEVNGADKPAKVKKKPNGNGAKRVTPPSFAAIPASDPNQVVLPNKFVKLEKLKGADYEKALAKLSPADRELYLQGG